MFDNILPLVPINVDTGFVLNPRSYIYIAAGLQYAVRLIEESWVAGDGLIVHILKKLMEVLFGSPFLNAFARKLTCSFT